MAASILFTLPSTFASADSTPEVRPTVSAFDKGWAGGPQKVSAPEAELAYGTVGSPLTMDDPYEGFVPVHCPDGTVAGTVDANGNQGDCQTAVTAPEG